MRFIALLLATAVSFAAAAQTQQDAPPPEPSQPIETCEGFGCLFTMIFTFCSNTEVLAPEVWGAPDGRQWLCTMEVNGSDVRPQSRLMGCQTPESPDRPGYADCGDSREAPESVAAEPEPEPAPAPAPEPDPEPENGIEESPT